MQIQNIHLDLEQYEIGEDILLGASTYFMDSSVAAIEKIVMPSRSTNKGEMEIHIPDNETLIKNRNISKRHYLRRSIDKILKRRNPDTLSGEHYIDMRHKNPENWAHALMNHLPISLLILRECRKYIEGQITVILPRDIGENVRTVFSEAGIHTIYTDHDFFGKEVKYKLDRRGIMRGTRPNIVAQELGNSALRANTLKHQNLPKKIFISRKDSRKIINESEILGILEDAGFERVYPEDYSASEQIALIARAESIVAIHGAALASLMYRNLYDLPRLEMVEIFTPAHVTNVYRVIAHQVGAKWIGIRGRLTRETLAHAYLEPQKIKKYAFENIYVDPATIIEALELCSDGNRV